MQYILLIYGNEQMRDEAMATMSEEEQNAYMGQWFAYTEELRQSGVYVGGEALHSSSTATSVTTPNGEPIITDGPFAETKEQLGGYYVIDVPSKDVALEWAAKIPSAPHGPVEVREIMTFDEA